jgi:hypothetical protein
MLDAGRTFTVMYKVFIQAVKCNKINSEYAQHILKNRTFLWLKITAKIFSETEKGNYINTLEIFNFHIISTLGTSVNGAFMDKMIDM